MKQAYISLVLVNQSKTPHWPEIEIIDKLLTRSSRMHEIVLVTSESALEKSPVPINLVGPLTILTVHSNSTKSDLIIAGLGRSVGDFILEWSLSISKLESETLDTLLLSSDLGNELTEVLPMENSLISQFFYKLVNQFRPSTQTVRNSVARLYSRRALNWLLEANHYESNILILAAELPFQKNFQLLPDSKPESGSLRQRFQDGFNLLIKGSRFGTIIPLLLSGVSSLFAIGVAIYALATFLLFGDAAEGWTSIAVVMGFGQAAILALIGLVWSRLDSLAKGLSKKNDATVNVEVFPANQPLKVTDQNL